MDCIHDVIVIALAEIGSLVLLGLWIEVDIVDRDRIHVWLAAIGSKSSQSSAAGIDTNSYAK